VRNIFICSAEVFCASSRMMNESLRVLWVSRKSSVVSAAGGVVGRALAGQAERFDPGREPDVDDVRVVPVVDGASLGKSRCTSEGGAGALIGNAAERPDQEDHVVAEAR
jgi:hypothetical protein